MVGWFSLFRTSQFVTRLLSMMMLIVPFEYWHALHVSASHNIASTTENIDVGTFKLISISS